MRRDMTCEELESVVQSERALSLREGFYAHAPANDEPFCRAVSGIDATRANSQAIGAGAPGGNGVAAVPAEAGAMDDNG
jgi:hypothetical protein